LEDSLSVVAVREARVESSSLAKARLVADQIAFSSDSIFLNSAIKAANLETLQSQERNHRLEAMKEERIPSRSASASFRPSKKAATCRTESLASTVERIIEHVPPIGGGAELAGAGEDACGTTSG
jgi:hypothetical protein